MKKSNADCFINIITPRGEPRYLRQLSSDFRKMGYFFYENSTDARLWDYVIVHDDVSAPQELNVRPGGLVLLAGEPEFIRYYSKKFIQQFDLAITTHQRLKSCPNHLLQNIALNWHFGYKHSEKRYAYSYDDLESMPIPRKTKTISVITSSLTQLPEHIRRQELLKKLKARYGNNIDFFGKGTRFVDDKADALLPYRFHIALENSINPHYWTEKLADPFLGFCVPLYRGDPCAKDYFGKKSFIPIDPHDEKAIFEKIDEILEDPDEIYRDYLPQIVAARNKLLSELNLFPMFVNLISKLRQTPFEAQENKRRIFPNGTFLSSRLGANMLRIRRGLFKLYRGLK